MQTQQPPMPAWMEEQLELVRRFQVRFKVPNPMVDFDVMPQEVWLSQMQEALTTGGIPASLQRSMGFTTSIGDASNPSLGMKDIDPNAPETEQDAIQSEAIRRGRTRRLAAAIRLRTLPPGQKTFPTKASSTSQESMQQERNQEGDLDGPKLGPASKGSGWPFPTMPRKSDDPAKKE
jgi:hypothetical protein